MLYHLPAGHVDDLLANVGNIIGNAFKVLDYKQPLRAAPDDGRIPLHCGHYFGIEKIVERIDLIIALDRGACFVRVARSESVESVYQHPLDGVRHLCELQSNFELRLVIQSERVLCDVDRVIRYALDNWGSVRYGNH